MIETPPGKTSQKSAQDLNWRVSLRFCRWKDRGISTHSWVWLLSSLFGVSSLSGPALDFAADHPKGVGADFADPTTCQECHPRQYEEWLGSSHSYAAKSPTFNTFEMVARKATRGAVANNGVNRNFCAKCHSPVGDILEEFPDYTGDETVRPLIEDLSEIAAQGVSCDSCHRVRAIDRTENVAAGKLGDGVANTSLIYDTRTGLRRGPNEDPVRNDFHAVSPRAYEFMTGDTLCGACHDVRVGNSPDAITRAPFRRLEDLYTEFQTGPYVDLNHPLRVEVEKAHPLLEGRAATCKDCHMSLYPVGQVGEYPFDFVAKPGAGDEELRKRRVSTHYFTGVDVALVEFPNQDDSTLDKNGLPRGLDQRRKLLLRKAVSLSLEGTPPTAIVGKTFPLKVVLTNVGAGHRVVSGFSQERQMWVEVLVRDASGSEIFSSGFLRRFDPTTGRFLVDPDQDGEHDEDWADLGISFADNDSGGTPVEPFIEIQGPDVQLKTFTNHFEYVDEEGHHHETHSPFGATNHFNNNRTLKPFEPVTVEYDIPVPATAVSLLSVSAKLRFRHFPPRFLRYLADRKDSLVTEETVDRLKIIEMAEESQQALLIPSADIDQDNRVDHKDLLQLRFQWSRQGVLKDKEGRTKSQATDGVIDQAPPTPFADINQDNRVDSNDLFLLELQWYR